MRNCLQPLAGYLFLFLSVSCSSGGSGQHKADILLPGAGVIHEKIVCQGDTGKSYALYMPENGRQTLPKTSQAQVQASPRQGSTGEGKRLYPVMIAFDPHGDGIFPLKKYKDLADKYGIILIGSNDSKNGLPSDEVRAVVSALMKEVHSVYPVDTNRIFLLGFSGGARVAAIAALYQVPVKGVIGCGAGFGNGEQPVLYKFDYFGIAGTADFNMNEMLQLDEPLTRAGFRHLITTFPGIHAWPPAEVMEDGFCWITLNAMKDGVLNKDDAFISGIAARFTNRITELKSATRLLAAADACREAISFMEGLNPADNFRKELNSLEKRADYQSQVTYRQKVVKKEEEEKQELMQALQVKDLEWWKRRISAIENRKSAKELHGLKVNAEDTLKDSRLMAFLSLYCYMNANGALAQQNEIASVKIIAIYEMADKTNPEPNYMRAVLLARRPDNDAAFAQLAIAVKKGFSDKKRLAGQTEFHALSNLPAWFDLMKTIK